MRSFRHIAFVVFAAVVCGALCRGCIGDDSRPADESRPVSFESSIRGLSVASRADSEAGWRDDDVIGVYMVPSGGNGSVGTGTGTGAGAGAPHRHAGGGDFTAEPGHELFYPRVGTVDFTAYHPWRTDSSDHRYTIDVTDQSDPHAIDLKWSANATGHSSGDVPFLEFRHTLAKLVFRVTDSTGGSLEGLGVVVEGLPVRAVFDLSRGVLAVTPGSEAPVAARRDDEEGGQSDGSSESDDEGDASSRARFEAIVLPGEELSPVVGFTFADGTTSALVPQNDTFSGGRMYVFDVTVTEGGRVAMGGAAIVDWDDHEPEQHDLPKTDPDGPGDPDPGGQDDPPAVWFDETMGTVAGGAGVKIAAYTGWDNPRVSVTDRLGGAEVRTHGNLGNHIWFPPGVDADVRFEGLPEGYTDITLSYDITSATTGGVRASLLRLYAGTTNMTPSVTRLIPSPGRYVRVTLTVPDGTTSLRWVSDGSVNTTGMRLDNIRLEGTRR